MNILLISRCPPYPLHLGDRLIIGNLIPRLKQRGYAIDLIAFYDQPDDLADIDHYRADLRHITLIAEPKRSTLGYLTRLFRLFPRSAAQSWSLEMWQTIEMHLRREKYDVVHLFGGIQVYEYRRLVEHLPTVIVPYESYSLLLLNQFEAARGLSRWAILPRWWMAQLYERAMFRGYRQVVVLTEADAGQLRRLWVGMPVKVIPNGVDLAKFTPEFSSSQSAETASILFVGNYAYPPNLDAALWLAREIFPLIRAKYDVQLWLVGNAPPDSLLQLASDSIHVTGHVPDVVPYYAQATVFICPLRFGAGIKNKLLEAMAMKLPIVATSLSMEGIAATDGIITADTAEAIAEAALMLLTDPTRRAKIGMINRQVIQNNYTWEAVADQYVELYRELAANLAQSIEGNHGHRE